MRGLKAMLVLAIAAILLACGDSPNEPAGSRTFLVEVSDEQFYVRVTDAATIDELEERWASGEAGVINGDLKAGDGGFNESWSWHLDPESVRAPDVSIELCDGRPSMVEADLEYWLETVERFCPWGAVVIGVAED